MKHIQHSTAWLAVLLALMIASQLPVLVDATNYANLPCDCWTGTVTASEPCTCSCPSGQELPYCAWQSNEFAKIDIVSDFTNTTDYSGSYQARQLRLRLGLNASSSELSFTILEAANTITRAYPGVIVGRYLIKGSYATTLFNNIYADTTGYWTSDVNITTIYPYYPDVQPAVGIQGDVWMEISPGIFIHTFDVLWLIFLLIVCMIACVECCCLAGNTEAKAVEEQEKMAPAAIAALGGFVVGTADAVVQPVVAVADGWGGNDGAKTAGEVPSDNTPNDNTPNSPSKYERSTEDPGEEATASDPCAVPEE